MSKIDFAQLLGPTRSVFTDEGVFSSDYLDPFLKGRKAELSRLATYFRSLIRTPGIRSQTVILQGSVGTGKTLVTRIFCEELSHYFADHRERPSDPRFLYLMVDCRQLRTPYRILTWVLQHLLPDFPRKGFQVEELLSMLHLVLYEQNLILLLCFNGIDYFSHPAHQDLLYSMSRTEEVLPVPDRIFRINLLVTTHDPDFLDTLDASTRSSLGNSVVYFSPYTTSQLRSILSKRAQIGLDPDTWDSDLLHLIAHKSVTYGVYYAVEILYQAGRIADATGNSKITPKHVEEALESVIPRKKKIDIGKLLGGLPRHHLIMLNAVVSILRSGQFDTTTPEILEKYKKNCQEAEEKPRKSTQMWNYLCTLTEMGILEKHVINRHEEGKAKGRVSTFRLGTDIDLTDLEHQLN